MTDCPVLIPCEEGAVGGIVSEPAGEEHAALILLPGWGRPARSGVNSFWAHTARDLAERGFLTLRFDYSREGETLPLGEGGSGQVWKRDLDLSLLSQAKSWFRETTGDIRLYLAGACSGGRLAIELAGREPDEFAGSFLVVPYLRVLGKAAGDPREDDDWAVDPFVAQCLRASLGRGPTSILTGEGDTEDVPRLQRLVSTAPRELDCHTAPDVALHFLDQPRIQAQTRDWLLSKASQALETDVGVTGASS